MYKKQLVLDSSNATENLGDFIIMDAVKKQLQSLFPDDFFVYSTTHDTPGAKAYELSQQSQYKFIGGTNLMSGRFTGRNRSQWRFGFKDARKINGLVTLGVGWQSDDSYTSIKQKPFVIAQKWLYNKALSHEYLHSVRDGFTQKKLATYGVKAINTACVTMWDLTPAHLSKIPVGKASTVVTTITDYRDTPEHLAAYREMLVTLLEHYEKVKLWIQAPNDLALLKRLEIPNVDQIELINPNLSAYDTALDADVDYVGTRLHAGMRALQHQKRTLIVEVDNRAREIANDTNLPTLAFSQMSQLGELVEQERTMDIHVPFEEIERWKAQFKK